MHVSCLWSSCYNAVFPLLLTTLSSLGVRAVSFCASVPVYVCFNYVSVNYIKLPVFRNLTQTTCTEDSPAKNIAAQLFHKAVWLFDKQKCLIYLSKMVISNK